jgi:hypothetical protein
VTLGKNMLSFASKFMDGKDKDDAAAKQLIDGLDGIYVRDVHSSTRKASTRWTISTNCAKPSRPASGPPWCASASASQGETTDIFVKLVNGESHGMFILTAEPKELTIVLILGPIRMDDLGKLHGLAGLGALGNVEKMPKVKDKEKNERLRQSNSTSPNQEKTNETPLVDSRCLHGPRHPGSCSGRRLRNRIRCGCEHSIESRYHAHATRVFLSSVSLA